MGQATNILRRNMPHSEFKKSIIYEVIKRILDIVFSFFILLFFLPVIILVSFAIKINTIGPILADTPERVGKNGKLFRMFKFRSMVENAHEILRENPEFTNLYNQYKKESYKLKDDPRITFIGHFIRKHSLDEIPQLINVIMGEMSLVGPRAYYPDELRNQQKKYPQTKNSVKIVLCVKPGVTGFWQVSGRSEINFDKRIEMDAEYVKKRSFINDLLIILQTPSAMITGKGAL